MQSRPLCSVIIPTYNCAAYLPCAIRSVFAQSDTNHEVIVVDDGSTDDSAAAIAPWRDRLGYLEQRNQGVSAARNAGLARARGDYVAFLDADDAWYPAKLGLQVSILHARPEILAVFADFALADEQGVILEARYLRRKYRVFSTYELGWNDIFPHRLELSRPASLDGGGPPTVDMYHGDAFKGLFLGNFILTSSVVVRRSVVDRLGGFTVGRRTQEDYEYWLKLALAGPIAYVDCPLLFFRRRPFQLTAPSRHATHSEDKLSVIEGIADTARHRLGDRLVARRLADHYRAEAVAAFHAGAPGRARAVLRKRHARRALDVRLAGLYLWSFLPAGLAERARRLYQALAGRRSVSHA